MYEPAVPYLDAPIQTRWGTFGPSHVQYDPQEYVERRYGIPQDMRGHRQPYGAVGEHPADEKLTLILLIVGIAILAYYFGKGGDDDDEPKHARHNPDVHPNCGCGHSYANPSQWCCPVAPRMVPEARGGEGGGVGAPSVVPMLPAAPDRCMTTAERRRRRRAANGAPRDKNGRFAARRRSR